MKPGQYWTTKDIGAFRQLYVAQPGDVIKILFKKLIDGNKYVYDVAFINCNTNIATYIRFSNNRDFYNHFKLRKNENY